MRELIRVCRAERMKMRRTLLPLLHIGIPVLGSGIFLWYFSFAKWDALGQVSGYMEVLGTAFPLLVSIICSLSVGLEEKNHFQTLLGATKGRGASLLGKCISLQLFGLFAVALTMGIFAVGEMYLLGNTEITVRVYLYAAAGLWLGSLALYPIHLFFGLRFSGAVSMAVGVAQSLLAALFITNLGENRWWFFPSSWSIRLSGYFTMMGFKAEHLLPEQTMNAVQSAAESTVTAFWMKAGSICLLITAAVYVIIFVWFYHYEGRYCND